MNKTAAKKLANERRYTWAELKAMVESAKAKSGYSTVNPAVPLSRAIEAYEGAIASRPDDERPVPSRADPYSRVGRMRPTGDFLIVTNILRDCA